MESDLVMTGKHCTGAVVMPDSIGLAAYAMDSHHVQRIVRNGLVNRQPHDHLGFRASNHPSRVDGTRHSP